MRWILGFIIALLLTACSDSQSENTSLIRAKSSGMIKDSTLFVEFMPNSLSDEDKNLKQINAVLNDEKVNIDIKIKDNIVHLYPKLRANTAYTLSFVLAQIPIDLEFNTPFVNFEFFNSHFENLDNRKSRLILDLPKNAFYDLNLLKESLNLSIEGENLAFTLKDLKDFYRLESENFNLKTKSQELILELDDKKLGLKEPFKTQFQSPTQDTNEDFRVISNSFDENIITLKFSQNLDEKQNFKDFISLKPELPFKAWSVGKELKISANFILNSNYKIHLMKGLKSSQGLIHQGEDVEVRLKNLPPALSFAQDGVFLATDAKGEVGIKTLNINEISFSLWQIFPQNISEYLRYKNLEGDKKAAIDDYDFTNDMRYMGKKVLQKELKIKNVQNQWVDTILDLNEFKNLGGVFALRVDFKKDAVSYDFENEEEEYKILNNAHITKNLIFSNIAVIAQKINDKLYIHTRDFVQNSALSNVKIELISPANELVKTQLTDKEGNAFFDYEGNILYILASKDSQASVLKLTNPLSTEGYEVDGLQVQGQIKAFIYTDKDIYRPGESVHLNVVARNDKTSLSHPITFTLFNPQGQKIIDEKVLKPQSDGFFYEKIDTDKNDLNGIYKIKIEAAKQSFYKDILMQSIVPNRIKVKLDTEENLTLKQDEKLFYTIDAQYLFGAKAGNLKYETKIDFWPKIYSNSKYPNYIFENPTLLNLSSTQSYQGVLDADGKAEVSAEFPSKILNAQGYNFNARIVSDVFESGGRSVKALKDVQLYKYDYFIGIKALENRYVKQGSKIDFSVLVSDLNENLLAGKKLVYRIYENRYSWWWDYDSYNDFLRSIKRDKNSNLIATGELISSNSPLNFEFDTKGYYGEMFIELSDEQTGVSAGESFYVSSWGEPNRANVLSSLRIKSDKTSYSINDIAKLEFESIKGAKALVSLSDDTKIIDSFVIDTEQTSTTLDIPIKKEYLPNIYVSVSLFQDYQKLENDRALRLFGVVPLRVEDPSNKLELELKTPEKILPGDDFEIEIQSKDNKPFTYTLAVVDEGVLDLTNFKTPDIWGYFYAKRGLALLTYDNYSQIIPKATGGDGFNVNAMNKVLSKNLDDTAQRFKNIVLYQAPMQSDARGYAKVKFNMPNYVGSVRAMLIAGRDNAFASKEKNIQVSSPVLMQETLPRVLRNGDEFEFLARIFKTEDAVKEAILTLKSQQDLIHFDKNEVKIEFGQEKSKDVFINAKLSQEAVGMDTIEFELKNKDYVYKDEIPIDIKAINPYTYESQTQWIKAGESKEFALSDDFIKTTSSAVLELSPTPIVNLDKRLKYLIRYPYGCIEQITSAALPQIFIDKLSTHFDKQEAINHINTTIEEYSKFQTSNGGFAYWRGGEDSSLWGSNYAGMFLLLAKENGYFVPDGMLQRWIKYEKNFIRSNDDNEDYILDLKANSLYLLALAKEPNIGAMNLLYEDLNRLNNTSKWQLGAAYKLSGMEETAKKIASLASTEPDSSYNFYANTYGTALRDKAIIFNAYKEIYGENNEVLLKELSEALLSNDYLSTQSSAYLLYALAQSVNLQKAQDNFMDASLNLNGEEIALTQNQAQNFKLTQEKAIIKTKKDIFVSFEQEGIKLKNSKAFSNRLSIVREFYNEKGEKIDEKRLKSSQSFYMKLKISLDSTSSGVQNIALTQILPSGWEPANTLLDDKMPEFAKNSHYDFIDIRDDKIMWFFDLYDSKSFFIKLNAITPGTYTLSGAFAEAMYDRTYQALSESEKVSVER